MSAVILQPHSNTNPSDNYRVVDNRKWNAAVNDGKPAPVISEHPDYASAEAARDAINREQENTT